MKKKNIFWILICMSLLIACADFSRGAFAWWGGDEKIVMPEGRVKKIKWTNAELQKDPVKRDISQTQEASFHMIRLEKSEVPHIHETHDLTAIVTKGMGIIHYGDKAFSISKGDVVRIPRGVPHWVENTGNQAMEAFAIFVPPFDGKDMRPTGPPKARAYAY